MNALTPEVLAELDRMEREDDMDLDAELFLYARELIDAASERDRLREQVKTLREALEDLSGWVSIDAYFEGVSGKNKGATRLLEKCRAALAATDPKGNS